jgi:hypothetical protein
LLVVLVACDRPVPHDASGSKKADAPREAAPAPAPTPAKRDVETKTAEPPSTPAPAHSAGFALDFDADTVGGPAVGVEPVIGDWLVGEHEGARGLLVDGTRWRNGTPSANLVDQARRLYGERYAEFLDGVKAFAFFPLAVVEKEPPMGDLRISVRFFAIAGKIDQAAGIAFAIEPNGNYYGIRANPLEDNILLFRVQRGKRTIMKTIRNTPTPTRTWHDLVVEVRAAKVRAELDGREWVDETLESIPAGRVGLWSKADSRVLFDDLRVDPL